MLNILNTIKTLFKSNRLLLAAFLCFSLVMTAALVLIFVFKSGGRESMVITEVATEVATLTPKPADPEKTDPLALKEQEVKANEPILRPHLEVLNPSELFNILILGIDRRYQTQESYRTDIIMLASINPKTNKIVLTSIPRDLWTGSYKINGVYVIEGYDAMKTAVKEITGQAVDRFIRIDFDALVWVVDSMGGVKVPVERTFTDSEYPNDRQGNPDEGISVSFTQGDMALNGEQALIYSRSRHGDNGEGSDFARSKRQQVLLKSIPEAFVGPSPKNLFQPFKGQEFYNIVTQHIKTDMNVKDIGVAYDLLKDRNKYTVEHFVLDYDYLVYPGISDAYGGQWVLIAKDSDFTAVKNKITSLLQ